MTKRSMLPAMLVLALMPVFLLNGCASSKPAKTLDLVLSQYEKVIRWSQWDQAIEFLAPESLEQEPVTQLDIDRLRLFRVTRYEIRSAVPVEGGTRFRQTVEIGMFHKSRAVERGVIDVQDWRYDPERETWLLHSGLPDVTQAR